MSDRYIEAKAYEQLIYEEGVYYPVIFNKSADYPYHIYMPIRDCNDDIFVGSADTFEEAYQIAQKYLLKYYKRYGRFPKYVNPYHIEIDEDEFLVMVKY